MKLGIAVAVRGGDAVGSLAHRLLVGEHELRVDIRERSALGG